MEFEVGSILSGKVTGITKFGAFVQLAPGKSGLVHISEIANTYVTNISDFVSEGQEVKVKLIGIDQNGRLNLSIKQALPKPEQPERPTRPVRSEAPVRAAASTAAPVPQPLPKSANAEFEDKLKKFMQDSDSKMSGLSIYTENRRSSRRRK